MQTEAFVADVDAAYGGVDICVANAGGPPFKPFDETTMEDWRRAVDTSLLSAVRFAHLVLPGMRERRWGRFLTVTLVSVLKPIAGLMLSNSIRATVDGLVKTLSVECAKDNVLINNLCPGFTATERLTQAGKLEEIEARLPMGRVATPQEFAVWRSSWLLKGRATSAANRSPCPPPLAGVEARGLAEGRRFGFGKQTVSAPRLRLCGSTISPTARKHLLKQKSA